MKSVLISVITLVVIGLIVFFIFKLDKSKDNNTKSTSTQNKQEQTMNTNDTNTNADSGLKIEDIKVGTGEQAKAGDTLNVKYTGTLTDGTVFDSTDNHGGEPFSFTVGQGQVIQGWDEGLIGMKVGGTRKLTIPADLGYGSQAVGSIPANSTLIFTIELVSIN